MNARARRARVPSHHGVPARSHVTSRQVRPSIVIVEYNTLRHLPRCLESLARLHVAPGEHEVLVVDNGSPTPARELAERFPWIRLLETGETSGELRIVRDVTERVSREIEYERILRTSIDAFWLLDGHGRIIDANPAAARMLGYAEEEIIGRPITDIDANETPEQTRHHIERLRRRGFDRFETRHRRRDGSLVDVEISVSYVADLRDRMVAFVRDISERKRVASERELMLDVLQRLNRSRELHPVLGEVAGLLREWSGCEAVEVRLREEDACTVLGPSPAAGDGPGVRLCRCPDPRSEPDPECVCHRVIAGRVDPDLPVFTEFGSFWTNRASDLFESAEWRDHRLHRQRRCHEESHESVALIPLRHGDRRFGLLQLGDRSRDRFDPPRIAFLEQLASSLALASARRPGT